MLSCNCVPKPSPGLTFSFQYIQSRCTQNRHLNNQAHGPYTSLPAPLSHQPLVLWCLLVHSISVLTAFSKRTTCPPPPVPYTYTPPCPITSRFTSPPLWLSSARQSSKLRPIVNLNTWQPSNRDHLRTGQQAVKRITYPSSCGRTAHTQKHVCMPFLCFEFQAHSTCTLQKMISFSLRVQPDLADNTETHVSQSSSL